jgi:hypothetical protein
MPGLGADETDERGRERERAQRIRDVRMAVGWVGAGDGDGDGDGDGEDGEDECAGGSRNGQAVEGEDTETATGLDVPAPDLTYIRGVGVVMLYSKHWGMYFRDL